MPTTAAQRALARFRAEEDAFRVVLDALVEWRREDLVVKMFGVYRARMRMLRRLVGAPLDDEPYAADELRRYVRRRDP